MLKQVRDLASQQAEGFDLRLIEAALCGIRYRKHADHASFRHGERNAGEEPDTGWPCHQSAVLEKLIRGGILHMNQFVGRHDHRVQRGRTGHLPEF
ncbi:hypothetical protein D9M68_535040 [compost metagenome]